MIDLTIPGTGNIQINHLVLDVNGTLALDGTLFDGLPRIIGALSNRLDIHMVTADTHGRQQEIDHVLNMTAVRLQPGDEAEQKRDYVRSLGSHKCAAIGQGANDALMLAETCLGIAVFSPEGLCVDTLKSARIVMPDIFSALALLDNPQRLVATLRK